MTAARAMPDKLPSFICGRRTVIHALTDACGHFAT